MIREDFIVEGIVFNVTIAMPAHATGWFSVNVCGPGKRRKLREYCLGWNGERFAHSGALQELERYHPNVLPQILQWLQSPEMREALSTATNK
jgi:hypothetical protein